MTIKVYQGERPLAADNHLLGEFNVEDIPSARAGVPKIEVAFNLDHAGILNVIVRDEGTGKKRIIKLESSGGLSNVDAAADGVGALAIWEPFDEPKDCDEG